jgi:putative membrane protein
VGALRAVWPFWTVRYELSALHLKQGPILCIVDPILPDIASVGFYISCLFFTLGISLVFLVERMAKRRQSTASSATL